MRISRGIFFLLLLSGWGLAAWLIWKGKSPTRYAQRQDHSGETNDPRLGQIFHEWSSVPELAGALVGLSILDENGRTLFASPLAETALCPASALKTLTTGAAFDLLGPDFRFETTLYSLVAINDEGVIEGDLVLEGKGDPTLSSGDLDRLAEAAVGKKLKRVTGRLRVDASHFPPLPANEHWNWGDVGNAYGAGAFGVNVDHNRMRIVFSPGIRAGDPVEIRGTEPSMSGLEWIHHVTTGAPGSGDVVTVYSEPYGRRITLHGSVPAGTSPFRVNAAIPDPPRFAEERLRKALEDRGVVFDDRDVDLDSTSTRGFSVSHLSPPLAEIIDHLHRVSDNLEAQCLFLEMGLKAGRPPSAALSTYWKNAGVSFTGLRLIDGSGLARANMIRPIDLARTNYAARRSSCGDRFHQSLSTYLDGKVSSKLGAMSGVKTDVGFLTLPDGREWTYALMANGLDTRLNFWPMRARLLEQIYQSQPTND